MKILGLEIQRLNHACIKIKDEKVIYFDPFQIPPDEKADLILITHEHYDHCSLEDIKKILKKDTIIIASIQCEKELKKLKKVKEIHYLRPYQKIEIDGILVEAVPSYNLNKPFHPKEDKKLGYVVTIENKKIYHAGDTDFIPEMRDLKDIDIAFLPVSGTYVMTAEEAVEAVKAIKPKVAIPMHYAAIVGSKEDAEKFKKLAENFCEILII